MRRSPFFATTTGLVRVIPTGRGSPRRTRCSQRKEGWLSRQAGRDGYKRVKLMDHVREVDWATATPGEPRDKQLDTQGQSSVFFSKRVKWSPGSLRAMLEKAYPFPKLRSRSHLQGKVLHLGACSNCVWNKGTRCTPCLVRTSGRWDQQLDE